MSTYIFQQLAKKGRSAGMGLNKASFAQSTAWFRKAARQVKDVNTNLLLDSNKSRLFTRHGPEDIGSMLMYNYDPKTKDKMPYWDQFPLIFVIEYYEDGWLGINLHYLDPVMRAKLMDALYTISTSSKGKITKLKISYQILKSAAKFAAFKPCVKRYLKSHIRSRFFYVDPSEWDMALMLPTERFVGASKSKVWRDSREMIK